MAPAICKICSKTLTNKSSLKRHALTHEQMREKLQCKGCNRYFTTAFGLKEHFALCKPGESLESEDLEKRFSIERVVKMFKCDICGKSLGRLDHLKSHIISAHVGTAKSKCDVCCKNGIEKNFGRASDLRKHLKKYHAIHADEPTPTVAAGVDANISASELNENVEFSDGMDLDQSISQNTCPSNLPLKKRKYPSMKENSNANIESNILPMPPLAKEFAQKPIEFYLPNEYTATSCNFDMITANIYSDTVQPLKSSDLHPCDCKAEVECRENCFNRTIYMECDTKSCAAGQNCQNTSIQKNITANIQCFETNNKGWGVRAIEVIKRGTFIVEYTGEVISLSECKNRMRTIYRDQTAQYCLHLQSKQVIDATRMGSLGRLVNHSCHPNCEIQKWTVEGLPRMALFALRDIKVAEELTFDYNFCHFGSGHQACRCESRNCRGWIGKKSKVGRIKRTRLMNDESVERKKKKIGKKKSKSKGSHLGIHFCVRVEWTRAGCKFTSVKRTILSALIDGKFPLNDMKPVFLFTEPNLSSK